MLALSLAAVSSSGQWLWSSYIRRKPSPISGSRSVNSSPRRIQRATSARPSDCSTSPSSLWLLAFVSPSGWSGRGATRVPQGPVRTVVHVQWPAGRDPGRRAAHAAPPERDRQRFCATADWGVQQRGDLAQRKPHVPQHENPLQAADILVAVESIASLRTMRRRQQLEPVVVMQCPYSNAAKLCELLDAEC